MVLCLARSANNNNLCVCWRLGPPCDHSSPPYPGTTRARPGGSGDQGKDPFSRAMAGIDVPTPEQLNGITTVAHALTWVGLEGNVSMPWALFPVFGSWGKSQQTLCGWRSISRVCGGWRDRRCRFVMGPSPPAAAVAAGAPAAPRQRFQVLSRTSWTAVLRCWKKYKEGR